MVITTSELLSYIMPEQLALHINDFTNYESKHWNGIYCLEDFIAKCGERRAMDFLLFRYYMAGNNWPTSQTHYQYE